MFGTIIRGNQEVENIIQLVFLFYCIIGLAYAMCIARDCRIFKKYILFTILFAFAIIFYAGCEFVNNPAMFRVWRMCRANPGAILLFC